MSYDNDGRYEDSFHGDQAVLADVAERAAVAENAIDRIDLENGRALIRMLRREGDRVVETLVDPSEYGDAPARKTGTVRPTTIEALIRYVTKHQGGGTEVWVDRDKYRFEAVIDDHLPGSGPAFGGWGDHRAITELRPTKDFLRWTSFDGKLLTQGDFAELLEQGAHNIQNPPAADLLEIAQTLHGTRNVNWRSQQRVNNGQVQFRYEEQIDGRAGPAGELEIPQSFLLVLELFRGTPPVNLMADFRWRLNDGRVTLGYRLRQIDQAVDAVLDDMIEAIENNLGIEAILGTPRAARSLAAPGLSR